MKVLVCGGRDFSDKTLLWNSLDALHNKTPITIIIQGGARGADFLAKQWATEKAISCVTYEADWSSHGASAGAIRNIKMAREAKPDLVLAFPGGRGTKHMIKTAHTYLIPYEVIS